MIENNNQVAKTTFDFLQFSNAVFNFYTQLSVALITAPLNQKENKNKMNF